MFKTMWDISNDDFIKIINESTTYSDALRKCGYTNLGNRGTIKKRIEALNLSVEHFVKYNPKQRKRDLSEIFIENSTYNSNHEIKKILYNEFNWEYKCGECGISDWNGKPLSLELDHINGNNKDNRIENLRLQCLNCHSQTPTFRGKNKTSINTIVGGENKIPIDKIIRECTNCKIEIHKNNVSGYCKSCIPKYRTQTFKIKERPSLSTLENDIKELKSFVAVGKKYNVSDNAIRKWIRRYNKEGIQNLDELKDLKINDE